MTAKEAAAFVQGGAMGIAIAILTFQPVPYVETMPYAYGVVLAPVVFLLGVLIEKTANSDK